MKKLFAVIITCGCLFLAARSIEWNGVWTVLKTAEWQYVLVAVPLLVASYLMRTLRWYYLFPLKVRHSGLHHLFPIMMIGYFANNFLPARSGELVRVFMMRRHSEAAQAGTLATIVAERTFDGLILSGIALLSLEQLSFVYELQWIKRGVLVFAGIFLAILILGRIRGTVKQFFTWFSNRFPGHLSGLLMQKLHTMVDYLEDVTTGVGFLRVMLCSLFVWLFEVGVYACVAGSFGLWLYPFQLGIFVAAVNFASLAPTSPGGVGTIEFVGTEALVLSGLERELALAMVVTQHFLQYFFCLLLGSYYMHRLAFSLRGVSASWQARSLLDIDDLVAAQAETYGKAVQHFQTAVVRDDPYISMIIPAYNEEQRILPTLFSILEYFHRTQQSHEIIIVDDGSQDETARLVDDLSKRFPNLQLIRLPRNMGKGAAVRTGIRNAHGTFIVYNDADGATPILEIERLLAAMERGADLAIGSRALYSSETHVERQWSRAVVGRIFAFLVNLWVVPGIADTQCGFKMFRREVARQIFKLQQLDGFAFDVEILRIASVLGYSVVEVPVNWTNISGSKVRVVRDASRMLWDILCVRYLVPKSLGLSQQRVRQSTV